MPNPSFSINDMGPLPFYLTILGKCTITRYKCPKETTMHHNYAPMSLMIITIITSQINLQFLHFFELFNLKRLITLDSSVPTKIARCQIQVFQSMIWGMSHKTFTSVICKHFHPRPIFNSTTREH